MTSRRARAPRPVVVKAALDPRDPISELIEVTAQCPEGGIRRRLVPATSGGGGAVGDEDSPSLVGLHELLLPQNGERMVDRHRRDTVPAGQLPARGQALAWLERPGRDARPQIVGHLNIRRPRVIRVWLHGSRVSRPSYLGRTGNALGGLLRGQYCSSVLYIALEQLVRRNDAR
jgi:hypothetical protein